MRADEFQQWITNNIIFLDGATGSNLFKAGMPVGVCPEQWILEHPDVLIRLQSDYVSSGSNIIYAPTFGANRIKLSEYGMETKVNQMNQQLVRISKQAAGENALVAGDITMTGQQLKPMGSLEFEELIDVYKEQAMALDEAGVDLFVVETMMSLQETRAAVIAIKETCDKPIFATLTFQEDQRTLFGTDAKTAAVVLEALGVSAVGANCSVGPDILCSFIKDMREVVSIPIIAKPNAGLPYLTEEKETAYRMNKEEFAEHMKDIVASGANIIGGCCGTSPDFIGFMNKLKDEYHAAFHPAAPKKQRVLCSEHKSHFFGLNDRFFIIGERINPTGKKKLQAELREGRFDLVTQYAEEQEASGASILDVNMGMSGIDELDSFHRAVDEIRTVSSLPLCIDSSDCDVIEDMLRRYCGRALVNSVSLEPGKAQRLLPLIKKYGAMFILLPLSEQGLPKNVTEKKEMIMKLVQYACDNGLAKEDIIVDGLVTTISANPNAAMETLETIRYCKENGLATVCGLSNISFGLPERSNINASFLTAAIMNGLTMAIANPMQKELMNAMYTADMLLNKKDAGLLYIEKMTESAEENTTNQTASVTAKISSPELLRKAVIKGNASDIEQTVKACLAQDYPPQDLLQQILLPAISEVGDLFNKGKYYLPQLIASANAMKDAIAVLEPYLNSNTQAEQKATIIIATVKGDIHDIGKNLVALMLKNYGYRVIDLGKDVTKECIIETAIAENAEIIALSALMTTTMNEMRNVVEYAKLHNISSKIIIGGAVITEDYAEEIGADGYSCDAAQAVLLVDSILAKMK